MKRTLLCLGLILLMASPVMAAVANSPHDMVNTWSAGAAQGICSYCHVPHSAQGARLWPSTPDPGIQTDFGLVGALCYSCHGFSNYSDANQDMTDTVYDLTRTNHPLQDAGGTPDTDMSATGWPYSTLANFECTTCHNVHQQTATSTVPVDSGTADEVNFLRGPYYTGGATLDPASDSLFCTECHQNRIESDVAITNSTANGSTHPVGGVVTDGRSGTAGTVNVADALMSLAFGSDQAVQGDGLGGGHTTAAGGGAGGVACWTCHVPHGAEATLLAYTPTDSTGYSIICEQCHGTAPSLSDATDTTTSAHPVDAGTGDDVSSGGATLDITRPLNTALAGAVQGTTGNGEVVCLSCHGAHAQVDNTPIFRLELVSVGDGICNDCHNDVFAGRASHPIGVPLDNEDGGTWPNNDALPLSNNNVVCETCHAGHNGDVSETNMLRVTDNNSEICNGCHTDTLSTAAIFAETAGAANPSPYIMEVLYDGADFGALGNRLGTHAAYRNVANGASPDHQPWKEILPTTGDLQPRYGTDGDTIICQSCHTPHDADPVGGWGGSVGSNNILYVENGLGSARTGDNGGGNVGGGQQTGYDPTDDSICQGCHVPSGTHAVQSWTVSRTGAALNSTSAYVHGTGPTAPADYTGAGDMTCESCHTPHAAATGPGSFILEDGTGDSGGGARAVTRNRDALCALCHFY